jgi:predicted HD superfamily hydrolase involved in NAD metabolism
LLTHLSPTRASQPLDASRFLALCKAVRSGLDAPRYRHVLGVARAAERLARRYGVSTAKARVAALLHDIARLWSADRMLAYAADHGLRISERERAAPVLLHARIAADIARRDYGVEDPDTLAAIEQHTEAVPGMSDLAKILYIADSIEPSRKFAGRAAIADRAERSLDEGMLACIRTSLEYLQQRGVTAAPETLALYEDLERRHETTR